MNVLQKLVIASTLIGASTIARADNFVGLTWGGTSNNIQKSSQLKQNIPGADDLDKVINNSGTWGIRAGQNDANARYYLSYEHVSDSHSMGIKMRQENLLASYDLFLPLGDTTRLFGGATLGLTKLSHDTTNANHDSDIGYAAGLQAGILQNVGSNASLEAGYRYLRSNASLDVKPQDAGKVGSLDLHSSSQVYLGANYRF